MLELPEQRVSKKVKSLQVFRRPVSACQQVQHPPFRSAIHVHPLLRMPKAACCASLQYGQVVKFDTGVSLAALNGSASGLDSSRGVCAGRP